MKIAFHTPEGFLGRNVNVMVYHEGYDPPHAVERFLPDGSVDLVIDLKDDPKHVYDNADLSVRQSCRKAWFSGMRTAFISISSGMDSSMMVVNFKPHGAYPFTRIPLEHFVDSVVDAEFVFGSSILGLRQALLESPTTERRFALVEAWLRERFLEPTNGFDLVRAAADAIVSTPAGATIDRVASSAGASNKHLISIFRKYLGVTPKQFQRVMRFQQAVQAIERAETINWAALACDCGFYDQSHFIMEFQRFSGFSPTNYVAARGEILNYVPVA